MNDHGTPTQRAASHQPRRGRVSRNNGGDTRQTHTFCFVRPVTLPLRVSRSGGGDAVGSFTECEEVHVSRHSEEATK